MEGKKIKLHRSIEQRVALKYECQLYMVAPMGLLKTPMCPSCHLLVSGRYFNVDYSKYHHKANCYRCHWEGDQTLLYKS